MTRISIFTTAIAASAFALAACSSDGAPAENVAAVGDGGAGDNSAIVSTGSGNSMAGVPQSVSLNGPDGVLLGSVTVSEDPSGLVMNLTGVGLPPGSHGMHLHEKGLCNGPKFESAGSHWNPTTKQHGRDNPAGAHAGDLVNLTVAANGTANTSIPVAGAKVATGSLILADADGTSLVIHAKADDYRTDPSGASGDRIACAVLAPPK